MVYKLKNTRNQPAAISCLSNLKYAALNGINIMPVVIEAVENYCTLGEISDVLREVFGEY